MCADLGFAVGGTALNWAQQESALKEAVGTPLPAGFFKRLAKQRADVLPQGMRTHADVSFGKMKKVGGVCSRACACALAG